MMDFCSQFLGDGILKTNTIKLLLLASAESVLQLTSVVSRLHVYQLD